MADAYLKVKDNGAQGLALEREEADTTVNELKAAVDILNEGGLIIKDDVITAQVAESVEEWLDGHPEATTTVQDGSLTEAKLAESLKEKAIKDYVTPQMFGAKGDGITDDTTAIQNALDGLNEIGGGTIFLPKGIYLIEEDIQSYPNIIWLGEGCSSIIKIGTVRKRINLASYNVIEGIKFNGNHSVLGDDRPTNNIVLRPDGNNILITNCEFVDCIGSCIASSAASDVTISNCMFGEYGDHAIYFSTSGSHFIICNNRIIRPQESERGSEAIKFRNGVNDIIIDTNIIENVPCAVNIQAESNSNNNIIISNNKCTTVNHAILTSGNGSTVNKIIKITNNIFENVGSYDALSLNWDGNVGSENVTIIGNTFINYRRFIGLSGPNNIAIKNNHIISSKTLDNAGYIRLNYCSGVVFSDNTFDISTYTLRLFIIGSNVEAVIANNIATFDTTYIFLINKSKDINLKIANNKFNKIRGGQAINNDPSTDEGATNTIHLLNNTITITGSSATMFVNSLVSGRDKYIMVNNTLNGVLFMPNLIQTIPLYIGQISKSGSDIYIATGTSAVSDWKIIT